MGYITGIVRNTANAPLAEVNMIIVSGPPHPDIVAITDEQGRFGFEHLRPGKYVLKAYGQLESDDIPVQVLASQPPFVEIWLGPEASAEESYLMKEENDFGYDAPRQEE